MPTVDAPKSAEPAPLSVTLTRQDDGRRFELSWSPDGARIAPVEPNAPCVAEGAAPPPHQSSAAAPEATTLTERTHFVLAGGTVTRTLEIGAFRFRVRRNQLTPLLLIISLVRLQGTRQPDFGETAFIQDPGEVLRTALSQKLSEAELLLGCLPTKKRHLGRSPVVGEYRSRFWFVVTSKTVLLLATSDAGDVEARLLTSEQVQVTPAGTSVDGQPLKSPAGDRLNELARLAGQQGAARLLSAARLHHAEDAPAARDKTRACVTAAAHLGSSPARILRVWLALDDPQNGRSGETGDATASATSGHSAEGRPIDESEVLEDRTLSRVDLAALMQDFDLTESQTERLLRHLPKTETWAQPAIALSRALLDSRSAKRAEQAAQMDARLAHVECLLSYGEVSASAAELGEVAAQIPKPGLADVELPTGLRRSPWQRVRHRFDELALELAQQTAMGESVLARPAAIELTTTAPLDFALLKKSTPFVSRTTMQKLHELEHLLTQPGALVRDQNPELELLQALSSDQLDQLRHPMARDHEQLLAKVQSVAAKTQRPDFSTLKLYCERITDKASEVARVVDEAATMLGVGHVEAYISRGHDDVGLRAFDNRTPVLLVGGQHLDSESRYHMNRLELLFAVAVELAHLRFEHARVGPRDVARGLFDKTKQGLDLLLSLLPIVAGLKFADRLTMATARVSLPRMGKLMSAVKDISHVIESSPGQPQSDLAQANETLLEAHRFSQLSADRAGILACGTPSAALVALLVSRTDYVRVAARLGQRGLLASIAEQRSTNPRAYDDLLMRIGFLAAFYSSDEFDTLRAVVVEKKDQRRSLGES